VNLDCGGCALAPSTAGGGRQLQPAYRVHFTPPSTIHCKNWTNFGREYKILRPRLTKYCWGRVPGVPGGVDAYANMGTGDVKQSAFSVVGLLYGDDDGDRTVTGGNPVKLSANYCRTNTRKNFSANSL